MFVIRPSLLLSSSSPCRLIEPLTLAPGGSNPMIASDVTDLPDPDSQTIPSTSPAARSQSMPRTALTTPSSDGNSTCRSLTLRTVPLVVLRAFGGAGATTSVTNGSLGGGCGGRRLLPERKGAAFELETSHLAAGLR